MFESPGFCDFYFDLKRFEFERSHIRFGVISLKNAVILRILRYKTTLPDPQVSSTCSNWVGSFILVRREGFEPPAFWSVGCLTHKSESFRLRFVLFATIRSADFPLFPPRPARSNPVLGQKWVGNRKCYFIGARLKILLVQMHGVCY